MPATNSGKVRIIGGQWKRTNIPVLNADGLRPTGDRQRETLFNWLSFLLGDFEGRSALDMFGGSGALSFEFLSRGGSRDVLCEMNRRAAQFIKQTAEKLDAEGLTIIVGNSLTDPRVSELSPYDLAFIDPPFAADLQLKALKRCVPMLASDGLIYVESPQEISDEILTSLSLTAARRLNAGASRMLLAQKTENPS